MAPQFKAKVSAVLVLISLLISQRVGAQGLAGLVSGKSQPTAANAPVDPLKRTTPRSAMYRFLEACHANNFTLAAQYLDVPKARANQAPTLAKELGRVLNRETNFEVNRLSNVPAGNLTDGLPPDIDQLGEFDLNGKTIPLELQRSEGGGRNVWLVSADSVAHIPQLFAAIDEMPFEDQIPAPLVNTTFIGTPLWIWLALVLIAVILSFLSRLLSRGVLALAKPLIKRYATSVQGFRLEAFIEPLRLILAVLVFRFCMLALAPSALLRSYITEMLTLLFVFGPASLAMRIVDVVSDHFISRLDTRQRGLSSSVIPLFVRIVKICFFCIAVLEILYRWGYPTNTILAGLGVGGLAIALAAQKTVENLFGSVSVITDRPVLVGDFCQFGGQVGTVEDIGLRSTRIRTLDRTVVTIPNSVFSTMTLENYSRRDRMWFHPTLHLRRDTTPEQIQQMMAAVIEVLKSHPRVDPTDVPVRFTKITNEAFDLEIFAYVLTPDFNEYLKAQSDLLIDIMKAAARLNVGFAIPFQETKAFATLAESPSQKRASGTEQDGKSTPVDQETSLA